MGNNTTKTVINDIRVYGDSLAITWPEMLGVPSECSHAKGGSRITDDWTPAGGKYWESEVIANPIPDIAVVSLGSNDLWLKVPPGSQTGVPAWAVRAHTLLFIRSIMGLGARRVIWLSPPRSPWNRKRQACLDVYRTVFHSLSVETPMELVDRYLYMSDKHFSPAKSKDHGIHNTVEGNEFTADLVRGVIQNSSLFP